MSDAHADRNMLVGNLALQLDFIDRDALVSAMQAWMGKKSTSLVDILVDQEAITPDTKDLLSALVEKHIALHAGDPKQSLGAVTVPWAVQEELSELGDEDLYQTLNFVSKSGGSESFGEDGGTTAAYVPPEAPAGCRFRIIRQHDKGGLGTVSVAVDGELNREVALKEIRSTFASDAYAQERFTLEAEITGGLEHPGIVPVYGFGHYPDGRPFYAMRFIRGDNLDQAIRRYHATERADLDPGARAVEFRRLLGHLVDVCHAIHYAHCRGVLHRDIKPANIMLGKYGETLVVDWGLARTSLHPETPPLTNEPPLKPIYSSGTDHTQQGTQVGTPAFMPPEQAEGRQDKVDSRSDIYSIGATLYELLAGARAFNADTVQTVLTKVRRGEFPLPRKVNSEAPRSLEAVCLKAMAFEPDDRYSSAAALAKDIEHWLADEPVSAWREPFAARVLRWIKRHRTLVASTAAALIAALVILSATVGLLNVAKNREALQRKRAEQNLSLAKQAVDTMLVEVASEELENVPQMEATRGKLLAKAREFYEKFREQTPTDAALRLETAMANKRLGDIFRLMGEVEDSEQAYREAIKQLETLHGEFPSSPDYQQQLANTANYLGVLYKKFDRARALETYNTTVKLQTDLIDRYANNPSYRQELARSHYNRGILLSVDVTTGEKAEADFSKAIGHLQWVLNNRPANADLTGCRQELARCFSNLAILQRSRGEFDLARENYQQAITTAEALVEELPDQSVYQKELSQYYNNLSNLLVASGKEVDVEDAKTANEKSLIMYSQVAAAIPEVRSNLGNIHHSRGVILAKQGQVDSAEQEFLQARTIFEPLVEEFPDFPLYADRLGNAFYELAKLRYAAAIEELEAGDTSPARNSFESALQLVGKAAEYHRRVTERYEQDTTSRAHLANDYFLQAWTFKQLARTKADSLNHSTLIEMATKLTKLSSEKASYLKLAAELCAIAARLVEQDTDLDEPAKASLLKQYASQTLKHLRAAVALSDAGTKGIRDELLNASDPNSLYHALRDHEGLKKFGDTLAE